MLSIISTILKTKLPKEIQIKLYKDLSIKSRIILIIKGKLGQYKIQTESIPLNSEFYFKNNLISFDKFLSFDSSFSMKPNFLFEKKDDKGEIQIKISDINFLFSFPNSQSNYYEYLRDDGGLSFIQNPYYSFSDLIDIHHLSYIKKIFKGLIQGYMVNLELKGIGYQADLKEEKKEKKKNGNDRNSKITKIEKNIKIQNEILKTNIKYLSSFSSSIDNFLSLIIDVGFSHNIKYSLKNKDIEIQIIQREYILIRISGIDKDYVNQIAAEIYKIKKPEPYKGKGIRYQGAFYIEKGTQRTTKRKT